MTERLTKKESDGRVLLLVDGYYTRTEDRNLLKYAKKLAHYEDLEEQGRLVVLPERFDKDNFITLIAWEYCPGFFGLKNNCESRDGDIQKCVECWEQALKGEER